MTETVETIGDLRRRLTQRLAKAFGARGHAGTPELDARLLLAGALGRDPDDIVLRDREPVRADDRASVAALVERRVAGVPVARLLGEKAFWNQTLRLVPETLVPRPDTETLVEAALDAVAARGARDAPLAILDLGTGSGAILLALASELPEAFGIGVDISEAAIRAARANAARAGLADRTAFVVADWAAAIDMRFDLVVSNPPYIPSGAIPGLPVEVVDHDPHIALDGGADGLVAYRAILNDFDRLLKPDGSVLLEVGQGQASDVGALAKDRGWRTATSRDLAGIDRVVSLTACKK
ncbi:peptide chain release factor N(5)-glutamine methyltransferase [Bauldia sp.]|uniref:peptide chain release factor N(5)-glutamine methyltransferase n=1 Tax=Bauldia sp. TaxID=2575872 RepID=UPI003BAC3B8B